jgi:transposase
VLASPTPSSPASDLQQLYFDEADHNIQALTAITLIEIARGDLQIIADKHPNVLKAITIDNVIEASIEREWLLAVGRRMGRARLAHFLCEFAVRLAIKSHAPDQTAIAPTDEQMARLRPYFPKSPGKPQVDDRRVLSGIVFFNRNGLRWFDAPRAYGPYKPVSSAVERTLYHRWKRWGERGVFLRMMEGLAAAEAVPKTVMIDATYLKAHRTASSLRVKKRVLAG